MGRVSPAKPLNFVGRVSPAGLFRRIIPALLLALAGLVGSGCTTTLSPARKDIVRVATFFNSQRLWLNFDSPPTNEPQGLKFSVFLAASNRELGVFGDGTLHVDLFRTENAPDSPAQRVHLKRWSFNTAQAMPFRSKKPTRYGWGYGLRLPWGDVDVHGKEIQIVVSFERKDGSVISGLPRYLKVPP